MTAFDPEISEKPSRGYHLLLSLLGALGIGALFLYLAIRTIPIQEVVHYLEGASWKRIGLVSLLFSGIYGLSHGARVLRWFYLVRPLARNVEAREVYRVGLVGFAAILLLPLRLGELVRPFLLARRTEVPAAGALASVVVERVIDGLVITALLFLALWTYRGEASVEFARTVGGISALIFLSALAVTILAVWRRKLARDLVIATAGRLWPRVGETLATLLEQFVDGFTVMFRGREVMPFLALTALYWGTNVLSMWVLARFGFGLVVGIWEMMGVLAVLVVGIMIPAGPAMAGNFEYFLAQGMGLYLPLEAPLVGGAIGAFTGFLHLIQVMVIVVPGLWVMFRFRSLRLNRTTLERAREL